MSEFVCGGNRRRLRDRNATLWSSLAICSARHRVFFSGDTGLTTEYATIRKQLGPIDQPAPKELKVTLPKAMAWPPD